MTEKLCFLIDDDSDDQELFSLALQRIQGTFRYAYAENAFKALEKLKSPGFQPDYIFLDLNMPVMGGKECLVEIRKLPHLREVPVFIYSTSSDPRDREETKKLGATGFITKPPRIAGLTNALSSILSS